jgi:hypothetical protein
MSILMSKSTLPGVGSPLRLSPVTNLERMYALDEAWNVRDWETFDPYHYGNCAWDALGICAALHVDGRIEASCPDCGETIMLVVRDQRPDDERLLFHCLVPAAHWWDDIVFT